MQKNTELVAGVGPTPCNCLALRQAGRHISRLYDRHLAEAGLRTTQFSILSKLGRLGAMPISKLADTMVMERTALSRAIGPLERDGLVKIGAGPDGRTRSRNSNHNWRGAPQGCRSALAAGAKGIRNSRRCGQCCRPADSIAARDLRDLRAGRYAWLMSAIGT